MAGQINLLYLPGTLQGDGLKRNFCIHADLLFHNEKPAGKDDLLFTAVVQIDFQQVVPREVGKHGILWEKQRVMDVRS